MANHFTNGHPTKATLPITDELVLKYFYMQMTQKYTGYKVIRNKNDQQKLQQVLNLI